MDKIFYIFSLFSLNVIYGWEHIIHPSLVLCSRWQDQNSTLRKSASLPRVKYMYWITSFLISNLTWITSVTSYFVCLFVLLLLIYNLIKNMLSTHHWCHVVDVATKISHSTELQVIRRVDNKYTQQHFYLVACRV